MVGGGIFAVLGGGDEHSQVTRPILVRPAPAPILLAAIIRTQAIATLIAM